MATGCGEQEWTWYAVTLITQREREREDGDEVSETVLVWEWVSVKSNRERTAAAHHKAPCTKKHMMSVCGRALLSITHTVSSLPFNFCAPTLAFTVVFLFGSDAAHINVLAAFGCCGGAHRQTLRWYTFVTLLFQLSLNCLYVCACWHKAQYSHTLNPCLNCGTSHVSWYLCY